MKKIGAIILSMILGTSLAACSTETVDSQEMTVETVALAAEASSTTSNTATETISASSADVDKLIFQLEDMFTDRDLEQEADLSEAVTLNLVSNEDLLIEEAGVYILSGTVEETTVIVEVGDEDKVQLVLDGLSISNEDAPAIYVKSGDKVFVTTSDSENYMATTGTFEADGDTSLDAVIFSKSDLVLNGLGSLEILSSEANGITSKDDLKITGGTYVIAANEDGIEANDSIRIYDGTMTIVTNKDGLHSENDTDTSLGYVYMVGGSLNITAVDDGIRGTSVVQIDGGTINIESCTEGIEATYIQINGATIDIKATDDGINASDKSDYEVMIELNGGNINIVMASGDTDAIDSNGNIVINGGSITLDCGSSFDADGTTTYNGGDVTVNGEVVTDFTSLSSGKSGHRK